MRKIILNILFILICLPVFATHNRAGEITVKYISPLTYEITLTTYTYRLSPADRPQLEVSWGDNTTSIVNRHDKILLPDFYNQNIYYGTHTFPGPGIYQIMMQDPNRNLGIGNIPNSVNIVFAIKTTLIINPVLGENSSPILLKAPIDKAALHHIFIHNPEAFDPDGDSLSYKLTTCLGENGVPIADYTIPPYDHKFYVDSITGDLVWDSPTQVGKYNVAMLIQEWRKGQKIGTIERDMQIEVYDADNNPPVIAPMKDTCVEAGTLLQFPVSATDPDGNFINLTAIGGPFHFQPDSAILIPGINLPGHATATFKWQTDCSDVRKQPYQIGFIAEDTLTSLQLVDIKNVDITVVSPAPKNLALQPTNNSILLTWDHCICPKANGYEIYRHEDSIGYSPGYCITGVPASTGYVKIGEVSGLNNISFNDNNNGLGLVQGIEYCYMVVATFPDGAESYPSEEHCTHLVRGIPVITNVSVKTTSKTNGSMYIAWSKPSQLDTIALPGPYVYLIYRSNDYWGNSLHPIDSLYLKGLNDTIYNDTLLNTLESPYSYKIELYENQPDYRILIGAPQVASSVFVSIASGDNQLALHFNENVPWINTKFVIYKMNNLTGLYDSLGISDSLGYVDINLKNGQNYCYKVKSIGNYTISGLIDPIINYSQEACAVPLDTVPPCPIEVNLAEHCPEYMNILNWVNPNTWCCNDAIRYNIYYSPTSNGTLNLIASIDSVSQTTFYHVFNENVISIAGCYAVTAIDSFGNESKKVKVCIDSCASDYRLPNVFTPNNDEFNQLYQPVFPYHFIEKVDMKIFDRWGILVFKTEDPNINWDGRYLKNNKLVTEGVYYYVCDVYTIRLSGLEHTTLVGFIHVFTGGKKSGK
ncbi:MAG: gliding motility-associated C-terminal domain-containing protein [Bacteroidia bacterium]|nr:gliding motility-associated C-terminal domain-containing protein [Bacteroidia bacterium]